MSRDNSGSLSKNQRKEKETHADYKGKATIGGKDYWISGWKKENDSGPWLSLAFEPKEAKPAVAPRTETRRAIREDDSAF